MLMSDMTILTIEQASQEKKKHLYFQIHLEQKRKISATLTFLSVWVTIRKEVKKYTFVLPHIYIDKDHREL